MTIASTIDDRKDVPGSGRGTNPLRSGSVGKSASAGRAKRIKRAESRPTAPFDGGAARRGAQFPGFSPLLEELEVAGWSSHRQLLSSNFHDWMLLDGCGVMVVVGQAVGIGVVDAVEASLVMQAAWATIRAQALHTHDAGMLLSLASRSLWPLQNAQLGAAVAVAVLDNSEGHGNVAIAGDCLAWTVRAATTEQIATCQPPLGGTGDFTYRSQPVQLSLRERLVLVADDSVRREARLPSAIEMSFSHLAAESHRRMVAADAVSLVRTHFNFGANDSPNPVSIAAVRRR